RSIITTIFRAYSVFGPRMPLPKSSKRTKHIHRVCVMQLSVVPPVWERGCLARIVGRVRIKKVKQYLDAQAEHHGYSARARPPVFNYRADSPVTLTAAHASFDLNHHLVFATRYRVGIFDSGSG